jgi:hypothetical protein
MVNIQINDVTRVARGGVIFRTYVSRIVTEFRMFLGLLSLF